MNIQIGFLSETSSWHAEEVLLDPKTKKLYLHETHFGNLDYTEEYSSIDLRTVVRCFAERNKEHDRASLALLAEYFPEETKAILAEKQAEKSTKTEE